MSKSILIIDDEKSIRDSLMGALSDEDYEVHAFENGESGLSGIRSHRPDVVLLDIWMPDMDGLETLQRIKELWPGQAVIMMSGHGTIETAVRSTKLGAFDFIEKPLSLERLLVLIKNAENQGKKFLETPTSLKFSEKSRNLIGTSPAMSQIQETIRRVAPTTGSVLITGENGTGKDLVAGLIHFHSPRSSKPYVEVNCAAIPEELIESELFGHEKGSFTGATQLRRGKFDLANGGTLFLDEIGDMSMKTQAKILRILQEQKFERVGGSQTISVDVRIVAATNKDLRAEIQNGRFREDLFYRLNVVPIHLPPLRDRREDVPILSERFLEEFSKIHGKEIRKLTSEAARVLTDYPWPGNVRELKNLIERVIILTPESESGKPLTAADLLTHLKNDASDHSVTDFQDPPPLKGRSLRDARAQFERSFILKTLKEQGGNISKTATVLGIERSHLHKKIKSYGIDA